METKKKDESYWIRWQHMDASGIIGEWEYAEFTKQSDEEYYISELENREAWRSEGGYRGIKSERIDCPPKEYFEKQVWNARVNLSNAFKRVRYTEANLKKYYAS